MPTPTDVVEQIIDPLREDVAEIEALEGNVVHISGTETITGLKTFTQAVTAPSFVGDLEGDIGAGVKLLGDLDMNGHGFTNAAGSGFEELVNKGRENGYAPLGPDTLVPADYLGTGGSGVGTNTLYDDGVFRPISAASVSFGTQTANRVFAGPGSGSAATPAFRILVAADIPILSQTKIANLVTDLASKVSILLEITEGRGLAGNVHQLNGNFDLEMGTPSTLDVATINTASGTTHTHAINASSNPGATSLILKSDGSGYLTLVRLTLTDRLLINAATSNLYLKDTSTGLQAATTGIMTTQPGNVFRSTTFTSGVRGWNIDDDGNAEFNNVRVRGELVASVFKVSEISATAGTFGVFFSAANTQDDFTTPASTSSSFAFNAKNSDAGGMLFAFADVVRFKTWTGAAVSDSWCTITARVNHTTYTTYTATLNSGSTSATYRAGTAAVDYGPSGTGFITLSADGTVGSSPNLTMATHAGSPWTTQTTLLRLGNLNGSYGYATDVHGLGIGNYSAGEYLTFDTPNGLRIVGSGGHLTLDEDGLRLDAATSVNDLQHAISWYEGANKSGRLTNVSDAGFAAISYSELSATSATTDYEVTTRLLAESDAEQVVFTINAFGSTFGGGLAGKSFAILAGAGADFLGLTVGSSIQPAHTLDVYGTGWFSGNDNRVTVYDSRTSSPSVGIILQTGNREYRLLNDGTTSNVFGLYDATAAAYRLQISTAGALSIFVGGSLKVVTEGAADSGGSGYKVLRVPN